MWQVLCLILQNSWLKEHGIPSAKLFLSFPIDTCARACTILKKGLPGSPETGFDPGAESHHDKKGVFLSRSDVLKLYNFESRSQIFSYFYSSSI